MNTAPAIVSPLTEPEQWTLGVANRYGRPEQLRRLLIAHLGNHDLDGEVTGAQLDMFIKAAASLGVSEHDAITIATRQPVPADVSGLTPGTKTWFPEVLTTISPYGAPLTRRAACQAAERHGLSIAEGPLTGGIALAGAQVDVAVTTCPGVPPGYEDAHAAGVVLIPEHALWWVLGESFCRVAS